jgi:hypothetical protein
MNEDAKPGMYLLYEKTVVDYPRGLGSSFRAFEIPAFKSLRAARRRAWIVSIERSCDVYIGVVPEQECPGFDARDAFLRKLIELVPHRTVIEFAKAAILFNRSAVVEGVRVLWNGERDPEQGRR